MTTPEAVLYLQKAAWHLASARTIAAQNIPEIAAREAYYGAFHAAQAYIFEGSFRVPGWSRQSRQAAINGAEGG